MLCCPWGQWMGNRVNRASLHSPAQGNFRQPSHLGRCSYFLTMICLTSNPLFENIVSDRLSYRPWLITGLQVSAKTSQLSPILPLLGLPRRHILVHATQSWGWGKAAGWSNSLHTAPPSWTSFLCCPSVLWRKTQEPLDSGQCLGPNFTPVIFRPWTNHSTSCSINSVVHY